MTNLSCNCHTEICHYNEKLVLDELSQNQFVTRYIVDNPLRTIYRVNGTIHLGSIIFGTNGIGTNPLVQSPRDYLHV